MAWSLVALVALMAAAFGVAVVADGASSTFGASRQIVPRFVPAGFELEDVSMTPVGRSGLARRTVLFDDASSHAEGSAQRSVTVSTFSADPTPEAPRPDAPTVRGGKPTSAFSSSGIDWYEGPGLFVEVYELNSTGDVSAVVEGLGFDGPEPLLDPSQWRLRKSWDPREVFEPDAKWLDVTYYTPSDPAGRTAHTHAPRMLEIEVYGQNTSPVSDTDVPPGEAVLVRGTLGRYTSSPRPTLYWPEGNTLARVDGDDVSKDDLMHVADGLHAVDDDDWSRYLASGQHQKQTLGTGTFGPLTWERQLSSYRAEGPEIHSPDRVEFLNLEIDHSGFFGVQSSQSGETIDGQGFAAGGNGWLFVTLTDPAVTRVKITPATGPPLEADMSLVPGAWDAPNYLYIAKFDYDLPAYVHLDAVLNGVAVMHADPVIGAPKR